MPILIQTLLAVLGKVVVSLAEKLVSEEVIETVALYAAEKYSKSTKTKIDDEVLSLLKSKLKKEKQND